MKKTIALSFLTSLTLGQSIYANDVKKLNTVTVTAQKTEQNIQDVPISMSVFDEFTLEDRNIDTLADIDKYTPGLHIVGYGTSSYFAPSIRGMYSDYVTKSSVAGLYINGVAATSGMGFDETLLDIERIEVLKGPQGTLYGKNTEVGVINVITKKPDNETKGKIQATLGEDNKKELSFHTSGAIIKDKFYIGLAGKHYEKDGYVKNTNTGKMVDDRKHNYGKINLRYTPSDDLELSLISSLIKYDDGAQSGGLKANTPKTVGNDIDSYNRSSIFQNALNINYNINDKSTLSSTTTYRNHNIKGYNDWDYSNNWASRFHAFEDSKLKTISEELKLNYEDGNIELVSGVFFEKDDINIYRNTDWAGFVFDTKEKIDGKSLGIFSHLTYGVSEKLSLIGGLRFDNEQKTYKDPSETIEYDEDEISPKIGLTYDLKENTMSYITISKGYRAGGFNTGTPAGYSKTYNKESLYSYEIGLKGKRLENKLTFDMAVYYMDISDMQVTEYIGNSNSIKTNAAKATSQGIETSLNYQATDTINLFGGFSYNDIKFDKYNDGTADHSGKRTTFSPKYNFNLGITYRSDKGYYASADITGYGDMYLDSANKYKRDAYELVNAKLGYEQEDYDIYLYAKNLFDKEYHTEGHYNGTYSYYSAPREIGIQLAYRF